MVSVAPALVMSQNHDLYNGAVPALGGIGTKPGCIGGPNWILSTIYTPEKSLGRPPPAGTPAALTYDLTLASLTTNPNYVD